MEAKKVSDINRRSSLKNPNQAEEMRKLFEKKNLHLNFDLQPIKEENVSSR